MRREVDRALAERAPDSADRYVALQKATLVVDPAMDDADLRAIPALATLLGQFDRYYGLAAALGAQTAALSATVRRSATAPKAQSPIALASAAEVALKE